MSQSTTSRARKLELLSSNSHPSLADGWLPGHSLPSTSTLPCVQARKSKAESQVLAGHFMHGQVSAVKSQYQ